MFWASTQPHAPPTDPVVPLPSVVSTAVELPSVGEPELPSVGEPELPSAVAPELPELPSAVEPELPSAVETPSAVEALSAAEALSLSPMLMTHAPDARGSTAKTTDWMNRMAKTWLLGHPRGGINQ